MTPESMISEAESILQHCSQKVLDEVKDDPSKFGLLLHSDS